ncbi:hypothetical protein BJ138DRAFT_1116247 [Hygrophoropsis aurantiaca]|uniref:Uncharacterized protein n=1 Tax=Hygrophoropsis aurantiaca TaxID=72124 RepID=A0ACB8A4F8_9AGAM|nr:hypothetical protein BJ138DRAFT_1116247 [Hygrophoropsis aurantiaca]
MSSLYPSFLIVAGLLARLQVVSAQGVAMCQSATNFQWPTLRDKIHAQSRNIYSLPILAHAATPMTFPLHLYNPLPETRPTILALPSRPPTPACAIIYSLSSACGLCQGGTFESWTRWTDPCPAGQTLQSQWPDTVPNNTEIPPWAYLPISVQWDSSESKTNATAVTAAESSSSVAEASRTASAAASSQTGSTLSKKSSSDAGAIAGGVMGGVVAVGILGFYFWRRHSQPVVNPLAPHVSACSADDSENLCSVPVTQPTFTRLYDPNDPSTFPRTPAPLGQNIEASNRILEAIVGRSQYTGVPEV